MDDGDWIEENQCLITLHAYHWLSQQFVQVAALHQRLTHTLSHPKTPI
jgi:hypothetical protein